MRGSPCATSWSIGCAARATRWWISAPTRRLRATTPNSPPWWPTPSAAMSARSGCWCVPRARHGHCGRKGAWHPRLCSHQRRSRAPLALRQQHQCSLPRRPPLGESDACEIVDTWLSTGFAGGRHGRRIAKISAMETAAALNFLVESEYLHLAAKSIPASLWGKDAAAFAPPAARAKASATTWAGSTPPARWNASWPASRPLRTRCARLDSAVPCWWARAVARCGRGVGADLWTGRGLAQRVCSRLH